MEPRGAAMCARRRAATCSRGSSKWVVVGAKVNIPKAGGWRLAAGCGQGTKTVFTNKHPTPQAPTLGDSTRCPSITQPIDCCRTRCPSSTRPS
jgi:hypothetical protein